MITTKRNNLLSPNILSYPATNNPACDEFTHSVEKSGNILQVLIQEDDKDHAVIYTVASVTAVTKKSKYTRRIINIYITKKSCDKLFILMLVDPMGNYNIKEVRYCSSSMKNYQYSC